jgi:dolichyl-phosphate beta-glucosyltransferase
LSVDRLPDGGKQQSVEKGPFLSVVVPAYNEEARLGNSLKRMLAYFDAQGYAYEILVVSDGSTDGTAQIVEHLAACRPQVRLLTYMPNRGKGYAVRYGILRAQGERILFSDADLATPIEEVEKLSVQLDAGYPIAIGSRDVRGSELIRRESWIRELGGKTFNKLVQLLTVPGIHDTQCGFKMFTRNAAQTVFSRCVVDHFAFDVEVLYLAARVYGLSIAEVPVRWAHQEGSKVRFLRDGLRMVRTVIRIRLTRYQRVTTPAAELHTR